MKITIEIPSHFYESGWIDEDGNLLPPGPNKAREVLGAAKSDWKDFSFAMADIIESKLNEMANEYDKENAHLEKCYELWSTQTNPNNLQVNVEPQHYRLVVLANGVITVSNQIGWTGLPKSKSIKKAAP